MQRHISSACCITLALGVLPYYSSVDPFRAQMAAEAKLAAAEKQVAELKQQLVETGHQLKMQSADELPQSHRLYRMTSGEHALLRLTTAHLMLPKCGRKNFGLLCACSIHDQS